MSRRERIIIVAEEFHLREFLFSLLNYNYSVSAVRGVEDAYKYMADNSVNLILLDLNLPEKDGITVLNEIKNKYPHTEVIMITAYASLEIVRKAMENGAYGFLLKPFDINKLLNTVEKALGNR